MILFRGLSLACFWYIVYVLDTPLLYDIHLHAEEHCTAIRNILIEYFDIYIEHPLYFIELAILGITLFTFGAILDSTFGILSVLGVTGAITYFLFFA